MKRVFFISLLALSCRETAIDNSSNSGNGGNGGSGSGIITGKMFLYGDTFYRQLSDASGIRVSILGTNNTTTTDANGIWSFRNLEGGIYTFEFTKPGFDTAAE